MVQPPIHFSPDIEQVQADEDKTIRELNEAFDVILERTAEDYGHAVRSVHAKAHGVLQGELTVETGLLPELAQVATVRALHQDSWDVELLREVNEESRFSVWTGLAAHQPLGNIHRARNAPYRHSADFRARFNGCPYHEPSAAEA